jgi:hypothetical protein
VPAVKICQVASLAITERRRLCRIADIPVLADFNGLFLFDPDY